MQELQVKGERFLIEKKIGSGCTSEVFKAVSSRGEVLCVKVIHSHFYANQLGKELANNEVAILERLDHPNILKFHKREARDKLIIVTEYCPEGTLYDYLCRKRTLSQEEALKMVQGVVRGCEYLMGEGVVHRDLKPQNVFLKGSSVKIADFGFAVDTRNGKLMNINVGSPLYMPFESLHQKKFSFKSDVFAIGVMWYELITGKTPFEASSEAELKQKVKNGAVRWRELKCDKKTQELIFKCLSFRIEQRPTINELSAAIQQMAVPQKQRSKTVYDDLTLKTADKQNNCNKTVAPKSTSKAKTPQIKKTQPPPATRTERCNTFATNKEGKDQFKQEGKDQFKQEGKDQFKQEGKDQFKQYIKTTLSRTASQQNTDRAKARTVADKTDKQKSTQSFLEYLKRLQKLDMPFLPLSIQSKFSSVLVAYHRLLSEAKAASSAETEKDDMLSVLATCTKEPQFCRCCLGFIRRLMRLAKSYKEWPSCLAELAALWERVERESNSK